MNSEKPGLGWVERARQKPLSLNDARRERMHARFVYAVRHRDVATTSRSRTVPLRPALGVALAAAAALVAFVVWRSAPQALTGMEVSGSPSGLHEEGWFGQGEVLETFEQAATLRFGDSTIDVKPRSRLVSRVVSDARIVQRLARGEVVVAYHPDKSAQQRLSIETESALVDVVGTRFSVRADGAQTEVHVFEGVVRVTPRSGEQARLLRAGQSATVRGERFAELGSSSALENPPLPTSKLAVEAQGGGDENVAEEAHLAEEARLAEEAHIAPKRRVGRARAPQTPAAQAGEAPAQAGEAPAQAGEAPAQAGEAPAQAGEAPAQAGEAPAQAGEAPAQAGDAPTQVDDFVLEVPGGEGLDQPLSLEELEQAKDEAFGIEVRKDPASTLDRIATLPSPERKRHLLYRFVRQVRSAEHLGAAWTMVAETWRKQGLARRALEGYRRARRAGRGTAWERHALFESGLLHRSLGEEQKFRIALETYLKLAPDGFRAAQARKLLQQP